MLQEPRRLAGRYLKDVFFLLRQSFRESRAIAAGGERGLRQLCGFAGSGFARDDDYLVVANGRSDLVAPLRDRKVAGKLDVKVGGDPGRALRHDLTIIAAGRVCASGALG